MSYILTALPVVFLIYFLRVQSIHLTHAQPFSPLSDFELPEIDGSAVDDICRIFVVPTPDTTTATTTTRATTRATTTTSPTTRTQVVTTTKKPAAQQLPRKPEPKDAGAPIRTQPAAGRPIANSHSNAGASRLYHLLPNSKVHVAGFQPPGRHSATSNSDESAATLKIGSSSSEDSSDES